MTRRNIARNLLTSVCAILVAVVFAGADFAALAQNTNSSTTNDNTTTNMTRRSGRRRGGTRRMRSGNTNTGEANANMSDNTNTNMSDASMQNTNDNSSMTGNMNMGRRRGRGRRGRRSAPSSDLAPPPPNAATDTGAMGGQEMSGSREGATEDLSGTYSGTVRTAGAHEMNTPATLTITGNQVTLASSDGSMSHAGRISAVNTRGYVGAALRFDDLTDPAMGNLPASFSVRARKSGDRLMLMPAPNAHNQMWFTPAGGGRMRRGGRRGRHNMAAMPAESAMPAEPSATPADTSAMPPSPPRRRRGRRRGRRGNMNANMNMTNTNNSNTPPPSN
jgi:hypothetical protein